MACDRPTRATSGGRAYLDLQSLGLKTGSSPDEVLRRYALEGLLARLAASRHAAQLVLKGGVLLAAYGTRRATRDIDLQARPVANEFGNVLAMVQEIAAIAADDGMTYVVTMATAHAIGHDDACHGVRVVLTGTLANANVRLHVDVNVGDPVWPAPQAVFLPGLFGRGVSLSGYPLTMVHAEKIVTAVERGPATTRWRDFADIYALSALHSVHGHELVGSIERVARFRSTAPRPLAEVLGDWLGAPPQAWVTWRRGQLLDGVPRDFAQVLADVIAFADPALTGEAVHAAWDPANRRWRGRDQWALRTA